MDSKPYPLFSSQLAAISLVTLTLAILSYLIHKIQLDYREFLALGPGGTPSTFTGYTRVSILRLFALQNRLCPPHIPANLHPPTGILKESDLPVRRGPRPNVKGIAPQRQTTQRSSPAIYELLCEEIRAISRRNTDRLYLGTSCFEKHSTGLFSLSRLDEDEDENGGGLRTTCNGEVCHSHPSDGSMHLTLHPADVRFVIERGWGERHPLARESWWWRWRFVPTGFMIVYAPRSEAEVECLSRIVRAASWWVSGMEPRGMGKDEAINIGEEVVQFEMGVMRS